MRCADSSGSFRQLMIRSATRHSGLCRSSLTVSHLRFSSSLVTDEYLQDIVGGFDAPVRFAIGYGSGVFPQRGYTKSATDRPMLDFIFGVTHTQHWHSLNLRQNPDHYSWLGRVVGSRAIQSIQNDFGAGVYFNTDIQLEDGTGMRMKYGVTSVDTLVSDLENWDTLYVAGRMQKPTKMLRSDARVELAQKRNLESALRVALLQMSAEQTEFTDEELFLKIAELSYIGDIRMRVFGEDPHKVYNIVYKQMDEFKALYDPVVEHLPHVNYIRDGHLQHDDHVKAKKSHLKNLPKAFQSRVIARFQRRFPVFNNYDDQELFERMAEHPELRTIIRDAIVKTTFRPSITQSLKGILTAGLTPSVKYARRKLMKGLDAKKTAAKTGNSGNDK